MELGCWWWLVLWRGFRVMAMPGAVRDGVIQLTAGRRKARRLWGSGWPHHRIRLQDIRSAKRGRDGVGVFFGTVDIPRWVL
jgi:hypothetical protein